MTMMGGREIDVVFFSIDNDRWILPLDEQRVKVAERLLNRKD